jgi:phosphatidylinositol alpha-1,6-mannosyltransferase
VLLLTPDYPPARGGIQTLLGRLVEHAHGLDWTVVALGHPEAREHDRAHGVPVRRVALPGPRAASVAALGAFGVGEALRLRPDLVLSGHVVTAHAAGAIHRLLGTPWIQYVYAAELLHRPSLARFAVTRAHATVALSGYARSLALDAGADSERVHVIAPGIDPPVSTERTPAARPTILTISRLCERYKGHDVLARALPLIRARVPEVEWVVIGDGPLRPALAELARALGVERQVRLLGSVNDRERDAWLSRAHVFAMPSRLPGDGLAGEGFGIVFLEAAARGLPVVAGNVGGALDAVLDGRTGHLVDPADPHALAHVIAELLLDPARASALGSEGAQWALRFQWQLAAARFEQLVRAAVGGERGEPDGGDSGGGERGSVEGREGDGEGRPLRTGVGV